MGCNFVWDPETFVDTYSINNLCNFCNCCITIKMFLALQFLNFLYLAVTFQTSGRPPPCGRKVPMGGDHSDVLVTFF